MIRTIAKLLVASAVLASACDKKKDETAPPAGDSIGVSECDEYVKQWEACFKDPKARSIAEPGFKQLREDWKALAGQGDIAKRQLEATCKAQLEALAKNPACK